MFQGSMVALVTPMDDSGQVDAKSLSELVEFHIREGTDAIVAVGTTGESATLNEKAHCQVIRQIVEMVNSRIPVIAGTGSNSTEEAIELTACAKKAGADACLLVTPYYNKPTQDGLYYHYKAVAEAVDIPQILYNVPGRTAVDMQTSTVVHLSKIQNIIGIKEATGDLQRARDIIEQTDDAFEIYSGDDATGMEFMLAGGNGVISVTTNVAPRAMHDMCKAALAGDAKLANEINEPLTGLHRDLFVEANPIPVKWALYAMGLIPPGIRLPLTPLSEQYHDTLRLALKKAGVL